MLKNNKGITLTALVITIIILLILASVATISGKGAIEYIKFNNAKAQFQTMQAQADTWYEDYKVFCAEVDKDTILKEEEKTSQKNEWLNNYGEDLSTCDATIKDQTLNGREPAGYRYFKSDDIKNKLDIDGISYDFLINISTGTVLLYGGIIYKDKPYYSAEDFGINNVEYTEISGDITLKTSINDEKENMRIIVYDIVLPEGISKYEVLYQLDGQDYWNTATVDMKKAYNYEENGETKQDNNAWYIPIEKSGRYNIKIKTASNNVQSSGADSIFAGWAYKEDSNQRKTIVTNGVLELKIGDYINYNATATDANEKNIEEKTETLNAGSPTITKYYMALEQTVTEGNGASDQTFSNKAETNGWRVLGCNEKTGNLLIISADPVKTVEDASFTLRGIAGYQYGEQELNKACSVFGNGFGATGARSVNVDDVNKITGYNPNNTGEYDPEQTVTEGGKKYGYSTTTSNLYEYGNKVTYTWNTTTSGNVDYSGTNGAKGTLEISHSSYGFNWYDITEKKWNSNTSLTGEITTLTSNFYYYYPNSLGTSNRAGKGLDTTSTEYATLFCNKSGSNVSYWLASPSVYTYTSYAFFGMRNVYSDGRVYYNILYGSNGRVYGPSYGVRPVVSLKSNIKLQPDNDDKTLYDIIN